MGLRISTQLTTLFAANVFALVVASSILLAVGLPSHLTGSAVAAVAIVTGLILWRIVAHRVGAPLEAIAEAAERISSGETAVAIPVLADSYELDLVSRAIDKMTRDLVDRERALALANEQLEERVAARTRELEDANQRLKTIAYRDALTGLLNRRAADEILAQQFAQSRRYGRDLGVLILDIDHFKKVNDTYGHAIGDDVLARVAQCVQQTIRGSDTATRFGGEEFVIILPETDKNGVARAGEKLRSAIEALALPAVGHVTVSLGGAVMGGAEQVDADAACAITDLLSRADALLYEAKREGRNRVCVAGVQRQLDLRPSTSHFMALSAPEAVRPAIVLAP